ncbi:hypothetical protein [Nonomuraea jabiensis]|uniref:hypothetical protein n=1 Tax=Nonomuraea jabiensis TaxID=882448 RepID=UPI0036B74B32
MTTSSSLFAEQLHRQRRQAAAVLCWAATLSAGGATLLLVNSAATPWFVAGQLATTSGVITAAVAVLALIHADVQLRPARTGGIRARPLLQRFPPRHVLAFGLYELAILIAGPARQFRAAEWLADLRECASPLEYAWSLMGASLRMRLADLASLARRVACWVLSSQVRTWGLLIPLMVAALNQVMQSQGWGSALWTLFTVSAVVELVGRLRNFWNVPVKPLKARLFRKPTGRHIHHAATRRVRTLPGRLRPGHRPGRRRHRASGATITGTHQPLHTAHPHQGHGAQHPATGEQRGSQP